MQRYQYGLQESIKQSNFIFESVDLLYYHLHETSLKWDKLYIKSPEWLKNKRATINLKNIDNNCFQYVITAALDYDKIENHPERISNIRSFVTKCDWKNIDFLLRSKDWKKFEQNNKTIALNILHVPRNTKQIRLVYKSKYNPKRNNQVNLLMITNGKKWHYLAVKNLSRLLRGIAANHNRDFYYLNCFHSYITRDRL